MTPLILGVPLILNVRNRLAPNGVALIHAFRDPVRLAAHRAHLALLWSRERPRH